MWQNETGPGSASTLTRSLNPLLDYTEKGSAVKATRVCSVDSCDRTDRDGRIVKTWCWTHYMRWYKHGDPTYTAPPRPPLPPCSVDGCERPRHTNGMCGKHAWRVRSHGDPHAVLPQPVGEDHFRWKGGRRIDTNGYVIISTPGNTKVRQFEHRLVMEEMLGRPLYDGENVHHINGVRDDNRPENLELWVVHQPRGQRPADLVEWAEEVLRRYGR